MIAHGVGGRQDLPIPFSLAVSGAAAALVVSFLVLRMAWRQPRFRGGQSGRPLPLAVSRAADSSWTRWALRLLGLVAAAYVTWGAVAGPDLATNPTAGVVYVLLWIGILETEPECVSIECVCEGRLTAALLGGDDCAVIDHLVRRPKTDPLSPAVIAVELGPSPALELDGKGRGLLDAVHRQCLLGLRVGESGIHPRGQQLLASQLRSPVGTLWQTRIARCGGCRRCRGSNGRCACRRLRIRRTPAARHQ